MIYENQEEYYKVLAIADFQNDSDVFIDFMLDMILKTLIAYKMSDKFEVKLPPELTGTETQVYLLLRKYLLTHKEITTAIATKLVKKSASTVRKHMATLVVLGLLEAHGSNRNRVYSLKNKERSCYIKYEQM
ncbi:hypothetical protein [Ligilactobacillus faecis]|uniref:hypothetical protein n=1 Tax=Ligilactobacillus faecis TaxID=762833 RepID=UPI0024683683|nr:hypothetical protein [Ligilactobacillus faecis]WGN88973.1 hypothetical protein QFX10_07925 [Ligilactobacillus faecis]